MLLLAIHVGLLAYSATRHSPTLNEPGHIAAGLNHWAFGRFDVYCVNPPLVHYVAAIPIIVAGHNEDGGEFDASPGARPETTLGERFISANRERSIWLLTIARWACIPFSIAGGLFCFFWSRELWGNNLAGLLSLFLCCFEPISLAHAELVTPDCAATSIGLGAGYLFWRWLRTPYWTLAISAGIVLGLAELTKTTWVIMSVLWPLLFLFWRLTEQRAGGEPSSVPRTVRSVRSIQLLPQFAVIALLALNVLNLGYGFDGSFTALKDFTFVSKAFTGLDTAGIPGNRFAQSELGNVLIPVPKQYLLGIDLQQRDFEEFRHDSYLRGEWKHGGWWYYYLYGLAVKTSHGLQLLLLLAAVTVLHLLSRRRAKAFSLGVSAQAGPPGNRLTMHCWTLRDMAVLVAPSAAILVLVSCQLEFNHHVRYVLPVLGPTYVFVGVVATWFSPRALVRGQECA